MNIFEPGSSVNQFLANWFFPMQVIVGLIIQAPLWIVTAPAREFNKRQIAMGMFIALIAIPFLAAITGSAIASLVVS